MKWFTYLLRHGIVVALVIGIAIAYVYRQQLFPKFFEQGTEEITVATHADEGQSSESAMDVSTSNQADKTSQQDSPVPGQAVTATSADVRSANDAAVKSKESMPSDITSGMSPAAKATAQKETADVSQAGQQNVVPETGVSLEAGVALDNLDANVAMADKGKQVRPANTATAAQGGAATTPSTKQPGSSTVNKDAAHPVDRAAGMMKDPLNTTSGMMQNPAQAMSGMMKPVTPGSGVATDSASTQTQPIAPGVSTNQGQSLDRLADANRSPMPAPPTTATAQRPEVSLQQRYYQIINQARQAYWQGQIQQSVDYYQQAIKLMPAYPDGHGELGNVYYSQGEWDKSGESLYQAAIRLLDKGRSDKAYNMLMIIRGLQHERAAELEKRIQAQQSER
jgi:hypothetical protein